MGRFDLSRFSLQVRTAWRLLRGLSRRSRRLRPTWARREAALEAAQLVSFDIFGTLLIQDPALRATLDTAMDTEIERALAAVGSEIPAPPEGWAFRLQQHRDELAAETTERPARPEVPRREVYAALFESHGARCEALTEALMQAELAWHRRLTWPNPDILALLHAARTRGLRVIAISDSELGGAELQRLLQAHGIQGIDAIYASCEHAADKFHGDLFHRMLAAEGRAPGQCLHIGDRLTADVWAARWSGIAALRVPSVQEIVETPITEDAAYRVGHAVMGPIFVAWARLMMADVRRKGWQRLAFVARDGDLLREVLRQWLHARPTQPQPALDYVHLSRRAVALAAAGRIDAAAMAAQQQIRAPGELLARTLAFHGLDAEATPAVQDLDDPAFQGRVAEAARQQRALLTDYLHAERLGQDDTTALVDIGWRGSIQAALNRAFASQPGFHPMHGCYFGLWEAGCTLTATGLLGDSRRRRSLFEAAPWQAALLLEPLCRAAHGTVTGYARDANGNLQPQLSGDSPAHQAERAQHRVTDALRQGVLDHVRAAARLTELAEPDARVRRRAQRRLLRLAHCPTKEEIAVFEHLVHTESHVPDWAPPLIAADRPAPWRAPRRWLAGLASPWRGGYVMATGGRALALAFLMLDALLLASPALQRHLQAWARRAAGL